ncbi:MAG TPA: FG-GAP-like repeat-containing protein [Phycisphaerae bacterium]|nr:FG-GAP-like repeat-containing protein [Phycisphaerae bacterium]
MSARPATAFSSMLLGLLAALPIGCQPAASGGSDPPPNENEVTNPLPGECPAPAGYSVTGALDMPGYEVFPKPGIPKIVRDAPLPESVDLAEFLPAAGHQAYLNSCCAWAAGYGLMTYLAALNIESWGDVNEPEHHFSPAFLFNQANTYALGGSDHASCCEAGVRPADLFELLRDEGCATWATMPYTTEACSSSPDDTARAEAAEFRITHFSAVADAHDPTSIKVHLGAEKPSPVLVTLMVGDVFEDLTAGGIYATPEEAGGMYHAVLVVGYDDERAAFKIMNSWGTDWGDRGFGWISYDVWPDALHQAFEVGNCLNSSYARECFEAAGGTHVNNVRAGCAFNPLFDSDGDGYPDSVEIKFAGYGLNPYEPDENPDFEVIDDADGDGWPILSEVAFGTDPEDAQDFPFTCGYEYPPKLIEAPEAVVCVDYLLFHERSFASGGTGPRGVTVADLNQDSLPDVVLANSDFDGTGSGANVTVLLGRGDGTLDAPAVVATGQAPRYLATGLLNGDAFVDLVFTDDDRETVNVLLGNGDGTFQAGPILTLAGGAGPIALADLDADGPVDLIVPGTDTTNLFFGAGDGTFPTQQTVDAGFSRTPVVPADLNEDGVVDLAAYRFVDGRFGVVVVLGAGDGTFTEAEYIDFGPLEIGISVPIALAPGDFDGDGHTDLAVALVANSTVSILFGAGDGTLPRRQDVSTTAFVGQPDGLAAADVDRDGVDDLALASQTGDAVVLRSNADGTFTESSHTVADGEIATIVSLAVGDLDGDADGDIIVPVGVPPDVVVLRNVCEPSDGT